MSNKFVTKENYWIIKTKKQLSSISYSYIRHVINLNYNNDSKYFEWFEFEPKTKKINFTKRILYRHDIEILEGPLNYSLGLFEEFYDLQFEKIRYDY